MNFQAVKAAPGQYVALQAVITEINHKVHEEYGPYALGKAQDKQGVVENVFFTIKTGASFPTGLAAGHSCNWSGKYDANTGKTKVWFQNMAQNDVAAQAPVTPPPQAPPQTVPTAPQATNAPMAPPQPHHVPVGEDATRTSIERQTCIKTVGEGVARQGWDKYTAADWLHFYMTFAKTGTVPLDATHQSVDATNYDPNQDDSDLPQELRA